METQNAQKAFDLSQEYDGCTIIRKEDVFASCLSAILWKEKQMLDKVYDILTKTQPRQVLPLTTIERIIEQLKGE